MVGDTRKLDHFDQKVQDELGDVDDGFGEDLLKDAELQGGELDEVDRVEANVVILISLLQDEVLHADVIVLAHQLDHAERFAHQVHAHYLEVGLLPIVHLGHLVASHGVFLHVVVVEVVDRVLAFPFFWNFEVVLNNTRYLPDDLGEVAQHLVLGILLEEDKNGILAVGLSSKQEGNRKRKTLTRKGKSQLELVLAQDLVDERGSPALIEEQLRCLYLLLAVRPIVAFPGCHVERGLLLVLVGYDSREHFQEEHLQVVLHRRRERDDRLDELLRSGQFE